MSKVRLTVHICFSNPQSHQILFVCLLFNLCHHLYALFGIQMVAGEKYDMGEVKARKWYSYSALSDTVI